MSGHLDRERHGYRPAVECGSTRNPPAESVIITPVVPGTSGELSYKEQVNQ